MIVSLNLYATTYISSIIIWSVLLNFYLYNKIKHRRILEEGVNRLTLIITLIISPVMITIVLITTIIELLTNITKKLYDSLIPRKKMEDDEHELDSNEM